MFDYFHKFDKLDPKIKKIVSSPEAVEVIEGLEEDFAVDLAPLVMKVMIKEVSLEDLPLFIFTELGLGQEKSEELVEELKKKVFYKASDYLGFSLVEPQEEEEEEEKDKKSFDPLVLEIYEKIRIKFNQEKKLSFFSWVDKYIRGLKSRFAIRKVLTEDIDSGGFSLSDKTVDDIFEFIQKSQDQAREKIKKDLPVKKEVLSKIENLSHGKKLLETENKIYKLAPLPPLVMKKEKKELKKRKELDNKKKIKENFDKIKKTEEKNIEVKEKIQEPKVKSKISPKSNGPKVKMGDIKKVKITGPIDELRYMDLTNLRRLSDDPVKAFEKIAQKLKVLEDIDYSKMLEGINAWRQSPVYKMYLNIFFKASNEGLTIKDLVEKLESLDRDYLNQEEIEALIEFNKKLNF
jgi:hypothetical protein